MARSEVKSNAKEFVKRLDAVSKAYHIGVLSSIATSIDMARQLAVSGYMNPRGAKPSFHYEFNTVTWPSGKKYTYRNKVFDKSPKLFIRSGRLANVLTMAGTWDKNKMGSESRFRGSGADAKHVMSWIRPQHSGGVNSYLSRYSITEKGDAGIKYRVLHEKGGVMRRDVSGNNFNDRRGSLIRARPFFQPAMNAKFSENIYGAELWKYLRKAEAIPL